MADLDLENWMSELPEPVRDQPFNTLLLPATHQSGAFKFDYRASKHSTRIPRVRHNLEARQLTQELNISLQLRMGIRHFEFELAKSCQGIIYLSQALLCVEAIEAIREIVAFLDRHKGEVVVVRLVTRQVDNKQIPLDSNDLENFLLTLDVYYDKMLIVHYNSEMTLNSLCGQNRRLLISNPSNTMWGRIGVDHRETAKAVAVVGHLSDKLNFLPLAITSNKDSVWRILSLVPRGLSRKQNRLFEARKLQKLFLIDGYRHIDLSQFHGLEMDFPHRKMVEFIVLRNKNQLP